MMFLGSGFLAGAHSLDYTVSDISDITSIKLQDGIFNEIHVTRDVSFMDDGSIKQAWDYSTVFHAYFNGGLNAGNIQYTADQVSCMRIKRRKKHTYQWITLFEIPITTDKDFVFERFDVFNKSVIDYEFCFVPVNHGIEGNPTINSIFSDFEGMYIMEKDVAFSTVLDTVIGNIQMNKPTSTISTLGSKFPYVIENGETSYYSGNAIGTFIEHNDILDEWEIKKGIQYRERLMKFLSNGKPKIIKDDQGHIFMAKIVDNVTEEMAGHPDYVKTSFSWVEIGDIDSSNDLYNNSFIDVNVEGV